MEYIPFVNSFRAPLDTGVEKTRGFAPQRDYRPWTCHPPPAGQQKPERNSLVPYGQHRDINPGWPKYIKNNQKNAKKLEMTFSQAKT